MTSAKKQVKFKSLQTMSSGMRLANEDDLMSFRDIQRELAMRGIRMTRAGVWQHCKRAERKIYRALRSEVEG